MSNKRATAPDMRGLSVSRIGKTTNNGSSATCGEQAFGAWRSALQPGRLVYMAEPSTHVNGSGSQLLCLQRRVKCVSGADVPLFAARSVEDAQRKTGECLADLCGSVLFDLSR